jgi:hypothetical protein
MALTATLDLTKQPPTLTVVSDRRKVEVDVTVLGETVTATGTFPITITDDSGRAWSLKSDDGATAIYTG